MQVETCDEVVETADVELSVEGAEHILAVRLENELLTKVGEVGH